jgi:type III restriction enzyme
VRLQLKDFQSDAVERLVAQLRLAAREATVTEQAVVLSSPTGSGKTIIATAAIERILEGDEQQAPEREARFLWLSDQPELNEQTLRKMRETSSTLSAARLTLIDSTFDQECLAAGRVYFLNTQKLGRDRQLVTRGDVRKYTIWETLQNTATRFPQSFFVFLDEAHRGMTNAREQREAATLVQKFIKGSPEEMAPVPIIVGISATPERFDRLIQQTPRTRRLVSIPVEAVRASGLLKDVVRLYHPIGRGPTDLTMLREAAEACRRYTEHWERYCSAHNEPIVRPVLVVQVQDGSARQISATDLGAAVGVIDEALGPLPTEAYAHAFQDGAAISVGGHDLRYLAPSEITGDPDVRVVFFKTSLNTGWDCPRAEVMMSFRKAVDATSIAQLVGRMVRTPLARRIGADEFLNMVSLYLPHYDQAGLDSVVEYLRGGDPDFVPPVDVEDGNSILTASRAEESAELFAALSELPSYVIPRRRRVSGVRRLMKLARLLVHDEIDENAVDTAQELLVDVLRAEFKALAGSEVFDTILREKGRVRIGAVDWEVGGEAAAASSMLEFDLARENLDEVFDAAGRRLGEGLHKAWWRERVGADEDARMRAKLEAIALAANEPTCARMEDVAQRTAQGWLRAHKAALRALPDGRQLEYNEVLQLARDPEETSLSYPDSIEIRDAEQRWKRHLYVDSTGEFPSKLNGWERRVLDDVLKDPQTVGWLRNLDRKQWSLVVPYLSGSETKAMYPDFMVLRRNKKGDIEVDLLDPHGSDLADAAPKAVGLARYAAKHADQFGRIEIIIVTGGQVRRLDLTNEAVRKAVLLVTTSEQLVALFSST